MTIPHQIAVIDTSVQDYQTLQSAAEQAGLEVILLSGQGDGVVELAAALEGHSGIDALHILSHGGNGEVILGNSVLNDESLKRYGDELAIIRHSLRENADILIYGCSVASDEKGQDFVSKLAEIVQANIAASTDTTGNAMLGGDWDLEYKLGHTQYDDKESTFSHYAGILPTFDFENATDNGPTVSQTVSGVTLTVSGSNDIGLMNAGGALGTSGNLVLLGTESPSMTLTFDSAVDVSSMQVAAVTNSGTYTWTFTPNTGSAQTANVVINSGTTVTNTYNGITSIVITSNVGNEDFLIDTIVFSIAASDPTITSSTYNASTGALVVTGTNFSATTGATNDVIANKFTLTGEGGATYTLTDTANVEITSATEFTLSLSATDKASVNQFLNKDGTSSTSGATYDLDGAAGFIAASAAVSDTGVNGLTVSNVPAPTISSATYDASTGVLTVSGTGFTKFSGATNDIDVTKLTLTGEGGDTRTLTSNNVEITSDTSFSVTLNAADKAAVGLFVNKDGTTSTSDTTYNLAAAEDWAAGAAAAVNVADTTGNGITVSNVSAPTITSATYDASTSVLTVTGTGFSKLSGATNDIDVTKLTLSGEGGDNRTLTSSNVEITSGTSFSVTLNAADKAAVGLFVNKNGTASTSGTTYNLAAAEDWAAGAAAAVNVADTTGNGITVSNVSAPTLTSATYDWSTGQLVLTGTGFVSNTGASNDVDASLLTLIGDEASNYTLTDTADVEITSSTTATLTLSATDQLNIHGLLNKNGTTSSDATTYNLDAADNWMPGAPAATDIADTTGNAVNVSNVATPTVTSATYDSDTGVLSVTGTNLFKKVGATNDVDISTITLTGGTGNATYTVTSASDVEVTSATACHPLWNGQNQR